ncbi:MAG TPA: hypothetical protein VKU41_24100 [Polyangiaceae bacterium]|nr:hypothetical protein [Polyangiaceae bacterium]
MGPEPHDDTRREAEPTEDGPTDSSSLRRATAAWRSWLSALATDSEAALAAALAYESLPADARDAWLDTLDADAATLEVPVLALYAPVLAVESDPDRRARIARALEGVETRPADAAAFRGVARDGTHACVIVAPVYLEFVQILSCNYTPSGGFSRVQHDPLRHASEVGPLRDLDGVALEPTPLRLVVDELAHAVLADRRERRSAHAALASFAHLFGPEPGS